MTDRPDFDRLGDLLPGPVDAPTGDAPGAGAPAADGRPGDLDRRLAAVWVDVVGAEVAGNARPVQLRDRRLVVTTSSSAWAQTLQLMSQMVIARLNERLGEEVVDKAVFRHAGWEDFAPASVGALGAGAPPRGRGGRKASAAVPATVACPGQTDASAGVSTAQPSGAGSSVGDDLAGFSQEEKRALADLELLPLSPSVKGAIRDAMKAGFVRARQDFGR